MKYLFSLIGVLFLFFQTTAQIKQVQYVFSSGGGIDSNGIYKSVSVVGEMALSSFATVNYTGTIGYLNQEDNLITDIGDPEEMFTSFKVFPNPSKGNFLVSFAELISGKVTIRLYDAAGQIVYTDQRIVQVNTPISVQAGAVLSGGVYLLEVQSTTFRRYKKLIIQ